MRWLSVGDVAEQLGVRPQQVTDLFYKKHVSGKGCPIVAGRRLIPPDYVEIIVMALRRRGIEVQSGAVATGGRDE